MIIIVTTLPLKCLQLSSDEQEDGKFLRTRFLTGAQLDTFNEQFKPNTSFIYNSQEKTLSQMPLDFAQFYACLVNKPINLYQRNKHAIVSPNL